MTNLELAKEQGNQAAPNVIDAAKASEVQIDVTLAQEQGNQAAPLIADSLASSESYDAIKQQGNQAMPLIVDALAGSGSDTGFELLDFIEQDEGSNPAHFPVFELAGSVGYELIYYGLLHDGHNLPNFTKLSVNDVDYDIYPMPEETPEETPESGGCYLMIQQALIDSQEAADEIKAAMGVDVKIGDTLVIMTLDLITEQALSGDVPFTLYTGQDSWSGTLHEYIDTSSEVFVNIEPNSNSTAYEISVYTDNASNPYYKIGDDGEWTEYDSSNKPEFYLPGNYTIYLKATSNYDSSEVSNSVPLQIIANFDTPEVHTVEDPSAMFAGLDFRVHLASNYGSSELTGRDDVVLLYRDSATANWDGSAAMTSTSDGYFAEVEVGWGHKAITYKVQIDGVSSDVPDYHEFDLLPMTPSFVDIINDQGTYKARLRFGANYPDMNTVEAIEYSFDNENWTDAVHDVVSGYELAELAYDTERHLPDSLHIRTRISANSVVSNIVTTGLSERNRYITLGPSFFNNVSAASINNKPVDIDINTIAGLQVFTDVPFIVAITPEQGYVFNKSIITYNVFETGTREVLTESYNNPDSFVVPITEYSYNLDVELQQQSSTGRE
jgi:hypothetical protein